jgi:hypothetical protein
MKITKQTLVNAEACEDQVELFEATFPDGATWPDDMEEASRAGLDVSWAIYKFRLSGRYRKWHANGQLRFDEMFERGTLHGRCRAWYDNGQLLCDTTYERGKLHGHSHAWLDNGELWCDEMWENGRLVR